MRFSSSWFLGLWLGVCGSLGSVVASNTTTVGGCSDVCTSLLTTLGPSKVYPKPTPQTGSYYSAQEASLTPTCILLPTTPSDVSLIVSTLYSLNHVSNPSNQSICQWAIEGGGHSPVTGGANIDHGITISLRALRDVSVSEDERSVSVGGGALWRDVYEVLTPRNLSVAGGRNSEVGVGGLLTGGGISFFTPLVGFSCDTVSSYLVVLGTGALATITSTTNPSLFSALKGGSNNFGIVLQFTMSVFPVPPIYLGGSLTSPISTLPAQIDALVNVTTAPIYDPFTSVIFTIASVPQLGLIVLNQLGYTSSNATVEALPASIEVFSTIEPQLGNTLRLSNVSDFVQENTGAATQLDGLRNSFTTTTFKPTTSFVLDIVARFNATITRLQALNTTLASAALTFEPIPTAITSLPNMNSLGLSASSGNLLLLQVSLSWINAADDEGINAAARQLVQGIDDQARKEGLFERWRYLNYAAGWQGVVEGYGTNSLRRLRRVSREVDGEGVFQRDVPGGFKLGNVF